MRIHFTTNRIRDLFFSITVIICVVFPRDPMNIKIPMLLMALFFDLIQWDFRKMNRPLFFLAIGMGVFFPLLCALMSIPSGGSSLYTAFSQVYPAVFMLFLVKNKDRFQKFITLFLFSLRILAILICVIVAFDFLGIQSVNEGIFQSLTYNLGIGGIIRLSNSVASYKVFLYASPLIVFLLDHDVQNKKYGAAGVDCIALFLTGTRANMLAMALYLVYVFAFQKHYSRKTIGIIVRIVFVVLLICGIGWLSRFIFSLFGNIYSSSSDSIKINQIRFFLNELRDFRTLLFGSGLGKPVYDAGRSEYTSSVEMMLFCYLYEIGLPLFIPFAVLLTYPIIGRLERHDKVAYLGFLISALTNPLLTNSTGYLAYLYVYTLLLYMKNSKSELSYERATAGNSFNPCLQPADGH